MELIFAHVKVVKREIQAQVTYESFLMHLQISLNLLLLVNERKGQLQLVDKFILNIF